MIASQMLCFMFLGVYDSKTHDITFYDSEISPSSDVQGLFSVQREPKGGPLYFEGDELGALAVLFHPQRSDLSFRSCWQPRMGFQPSPEQIKAKGRDWMYGTGGRTGGGVGVSSVCI